MVSCYLLAFIRPDVVFMPHSYWELWTDRALWQQENKNAKRQTREALLMGLVRYGMLSATPYQQPFTPKCRSLEKKTDCDMPKGLIKCFFNMNTLNFIFIFIFLMTSRPMRVHVNTCPGKASITTAFTRYFSFRFNIYWNSGFIVCLSMISKCRVPAIDSFGKITKSCVKMHCIASKGIIQSSHSVITYFKFHLIFINCKCVIVSSSHNPFIVFCIVTIFPVIVFLIIRK